MSDHGKNLWLPSGRAAAALGVSIKSLKRYADIHEFLIEGKHWRHGALTNSPRVWNIDACREAMAYRGRITQNQRIKKLPASTG